MIEFEVRRKDGPRGEVVTLWGEIDLSTAPEFERELLAAIDECARGVVVDLTHATFIDCACLRVLVGGRAKLHERGDELTVVGPDANLRRVFELTGLADAFGISPDGSAPGRVGQPRSRSQGQESSA